MSSNFYSFSDDEDDDSQQPQAGPSYSNMGTPPAGGAPPPSRPSWQSLDDGPDEAGDSLDAMAFTPPRRRQTTPSRSARGESVLTSTTAHDAPQPLPAIVRLQKVWVAERACPDLLSWSGIGSSTGGARIDVSSTRWRCDEIVDEVCAQIEQQVVSMIALKQSRENVWEHERAQADSSVLDLTPGQSILNLLSADEATSEEEHLRLSLVQLDVERARWLLRAYLRTRISKVGVLLLRDEDMPIRISHICLHLLSQLETYSTHYSLLPQDHLATLLSPLERAYLAKYDSLRTSHLTSSVLSYLPESLQSLTDLTSAHDYISSLSVPSSSSAGARGSIIPRPDLENSPVFVRCVEDCGNVKMEDGEDAYFSKGSIHLVPFAKVRALVRQGRVELM